MQGVAQAPYANLKVHQDAQTRQFRTVIREGAEGVPNFAGHLRVVEWGCGSGCQKFAIVDKRTGDIHMFERAATFGASFRSDSRLFIINPPEELPPELAEDEGPMGQIRPQSFVWSDTHRALQPLPGCGTEAAPPPATGTDR